MPRVQLAINVSNIDTAVEFYSKLFQTEPAKRRPGYANFAIVEPALKLVLIENTAAAGSLNHLGIEVESTDDVIAATQRFQSEGLDTSIEDGVDCCYAVQDKVWIHGPDSESWETYTVLADADESVDSLRQPPRDQGSVACCGSTPVAVSAANAACC